MLARGQQACHIQDMNRPKRPRDTNRLAKTVVDLATEETTPEEQQVKRPQGKGPFGEDGPEPAHPRRKDRQPS